MELDENQITAAGGFLGGLAGCWLAIMVFLRRVKARAEWRGRIQADLEQNTGAILRLENKVADGFTGINKRIDALMGQGGKRHGAR